MTEIRTVMQNYLEKLSLIFFKIYVADNEQYLPYLHASQIQNFTEKPYNLSIVRDLNY